VGTITILATRRDIQADIHCSIKGKYGFSYPALVLVENPIYLVFAKLWNLI